MNIDFILNNITNNGNETAIVTDGHEYTFADIYGEYQKAGEILNENGIGGGCVVSLIAEFSPLSIAFLLALIERDAIVVPISRAVKAVGDYARISESQYVIDLRDGLKITGTGTEARHELLKKLLASEHPGLILFSSGTTGEPKAALHDLSFLMEKFRKPGRKLSTIIFLLFDHIGGFNTIMHSLSSGNRIVTLKERSPEEVCRLIEKYRVELLPTSPTFINLLLLSRAYERYDLSSLKMMTYGTEPMPESTLKALHQVLPDVKLKQTYGLSEIGIMSTKSEGSESLYMKLGGDGYETRIVDGTLRVRAKSAMLGYLNAPSPFDAEGWLDTQDWVEVKGDYIKILGRTTDIINVGGEKVYPADVESVLLSMPGVKDARVYGEDNLLTGKTVVAEVCVAPENNNREFIKALRRYCGERLEPFKRPVSYRLTDQPLYGERFKKRRESAPCRMPL
ncbi:MAG: long-chain fatty acid--CoA ligase [Synergistaceae bacterium]|nr:long-chain fatty acid--CoA ligase [Synergistaceae bacterium]